MASSSRTLGLPYELGRSDSILSIGFRLVIFFPPIPECRVLLGCPLIRPQWLLQSFLFGRFPLPLQMRS